MGKVVPGQFRPTVIIFTGETGTAKPAAAQGGNGATALSALSIYEYFCGLIPMLDQRLLPGIAMLTVEDGSTDALWLPATSPDPNASPPVGSNAVQLLHSALTTVQGNRLKQRIEAAGYSMPNPYPQIYIVGQTQSLWIGQVAAWVNQALANDRSLSFVAYLLNDNPPYIGGATSAGQSGANATNWQAPFWVQDLQAQHGDLPLVDYCFLYEEQDQGHTYQEVADMRYALAEALFALVAANLTAAPTFSEQTATTITQGQIEDRIGSLATSMVLFPRAAVESYCTDMHSVEVVQCQMKQLQKISTSQQAKQLREEIRNRARDDANTILDDLWENIEHPYLNGHYWADLAFMENEDQKVRLHSATESIFQAFNYQQDWPRNINRQMQQAERAYASWQGVMRQAWDTAAQEIQNRIIQTMNQLLLEDDSGFLARIYAERMDSMLDRIYDRFTQLRVDHYSRYSEEMQLLRERANNGPWVIPPNTSPTLVGPGANGTLQAVPTAANATAAPAGAIPSAGPPAPSAAGPGRRSGIPGTLVANLMARARMMQNGIPTITNLVGAGMLIVPSFLLLLLLLMSSGLTVAWFAVLTLGVSGLFVVLGWLYRRRARKRVIEAEEDILRLYLCHFAYQCEQWEDKVRTIVLGPLVKQVRQIRSRLENMLKFTEHLCQVLRARAEETENQLFDSPGAYRDVLVGDGQLLGRYESSLALLQERVQQLRVAQPEKEWHQSYESMNKQMHREFAERNISMLIAANEEDLLQPIRDFCRSVVLCYLKEDLVEIGAALEAGSAHCRAIWQQALKHAIVLYLPLTNAPEFLYIGGRDEHRNSLPENLVAPDATVICTQQVEWLLVVRFWSGGAATRWTLNSSGASTVGSGSQLPPTPQWQTP
jgi:hypothetical protein